MAVTIAMQTTFPACPPPQFPEDLTPPGAVCNVQVKPSNSTSVTFVCQPSRRPPAAPPPVVESGLLGPPQPPLHRPPDPGQDGRIRGTAFADNRFRVTR